MFAQKIYANSNFTKQIFYDSFKFINKIKRIDVEVLYPSIDFKQFDSDEADEALSPEIGGKYFFSLNRYERKKNINLCIEAFADAIRR